MADYCSCNCSVTSGEEDKRVVQLGFYFKQLLYDIRTLAFVEGDIMPSDAEHARHQTIDIGEHGNVDRVKRILSLGVAECAELCYPFSRRPLTGDMYLDDCPQDECIYGIELNVPEHFSETTAMLLKEQIHEYLVCRVLSDWFSITKPEASMRWQLKLADIKKEISEIKNSRRGAFTRKTHPW